MKIKPLMHRDTEMENEKYKFFPFIPKCLDVSLWLFLKIVRARSLCLDK